MRYQQDLQVKLRQRLRRLMTAGFGAASHEVRLAVDWIESQPALRTILAEAALAEPNLDFEAFHQSFANLRGHLTWPSRTEEGRATLVWDLMKRHAAADRAGSGEALTMHYAHGTGFSVNNLSAMWQTFPEQVIQPLIDFLEERVGDESSVLFVLERYVRTIEWFDRDKLYADFEADRANGEEVYNLNLQRSLFQEGGYITHAKARSASGEADLIGGLDTDDPLVCEGKLFDSRGKSYLARGFHQVIKYAHDYNQSVAYLVVFNLTDRLLQFPTDGPAGAWPPYIEMAGVRVYFIGIRALPPAATASKAGKATTVTLTRDDLANPDPALPGA
ncbi:hypothetical protein ODJ79_25330 [Actinoplanes sp. KI2]|uniref:hypothetical protein n=1 Tax=Actinoplanes sp. KI2 TaxID=2983315 RepID=UPI0021D5F704|nr:hypothetical protein [Actinoplanes sp. KI2]MCU7727063.1 hypothetical protein [Actinoplanes sp. KI2]